MKYLLQLLLAAILITSFLISETASAQTPRHCTSTTPCDYMVCGDHICSTGEFQAQKDAMLAAQRGNYTITPWTNMTSGNMTMTQSAGTVYASIVSYEDVASDGTIVIVRTTHPIAGQPLALGIGFFHGNGDAIRNQNYAITIAQSSDVVLSNSQGYAASGMETLTTHPMYSSTIPLSIQVTLRGVGASSADPSTWIGVKGETLNFAQPPISESKITISNMTTITTVVNAPVPEFGPVALIVLAIAVLSIIVFNGRILNQFR